MSTVKKVEQGAGESQQKRKRINLLELLKSDFSIVTILVAIIWTFLYMFIPVDYGFKIPFNFFIFQDWEVNGPTSHGLGVMLIFMLLINPIAKRFFSKRFGPDQLIFANIMVIFGVLTTYAGFFLSWIGLMVGPSYLRSTNPTRYDPYLSDISSLVAPGSEEAIASLYNGGTTVPWDVWIPPFISWSLFMGVTIFVMMCMGVLVRRKWSEHEHLTYPIAGMTLSFMGDIGATSDSEERRSIWRNGIMWAGFIFAFIWYSSHHINRYWPVFPRFHEDYFTALKRGMISPLPLLYTATGGVSWTRAAFRPFFLGLLWYAHSDLLFSLWFFHILQIVTNMILISRGTFGFAIGGYTAITTRQLNSVMYGSMFGMGILYIWGVRHDIAAIIRRAFSQEPSSKLDDSEEPMSYRCAVIGGLLGLVFLFIFSIFLVKASFLVTFINLAFIFSWTLALARIRAESGIGWGIGAGNQRFSMSFLVPFFGTKTLGARGLIQGAFISEWARDWHVNFLSHALEGYKMADVLGVRRKSINVSAFIGYIIGLLMCIFVILPMFYRRGAGPAWNMFRSYGYYEFELGVSWLSSAPTKPDPAVIFFSIFSTAFIVFLGLMRARFVWWPFHPIGYFFGAGYLASWLVEQSFVIWVAKTLVIRWGGERLRKRLTPAFTGMIYGTVIVCLIAPLFRYLMTLLGY